MLLLPNRVAAAEVVIIATLFGDTRSKRETTGLKSTQQRALPSASK